MKTALIILAILATAPIRAQIAYDIAIRKCGEAEKLYLISVEERRVIDSVEVSRTETAHFKGITKEMTIAVVAGDKQGRHTLCPLVLDGFPLRLSMEEDGHATLKKGSQLNARFCLAEASMVPYNREYEKISSEAASVVRQYGRQIPDTLRKRLSQAYDLNEEAYSKQAKRVMASNKPNIIPTYYLLGWRHELDIAYCRDYMNGYLYKDRKSLSPLREKIKKETPKMPGAPLTDLTINDMKGNPHTLSEYIGKGSYVLLDFWASWCKPCRQEIPALIRAYQKYHEKGLDIVSISLDEMAQDWAKGIKDTGMTWTQLSDLRGWRSVAAGAYNIQSIPTAILFNPQGFVVTSNLRGEKLARKLEEIFQ